MSLRITSNAFLPGTQIPTDYTGDGAARSPPLSWSGVPDDTEELVLIYSNVKAGSLTISPPLSADW